MFTPYVGGVGVYCKIYEDVAVTGCEGFILGG